MQAVQWQAPGKVAVRRHQDPQLLEPTDAIIEIEATGICGSDLHLHQHGASMGVTPGDILGHEGVGRIAAKGRDVPYDIGTRVAVPFTISCGRCFMCVRGLQSQCEATQNLGGRKGASLFGYTHLYGGVPGAQASALRVPYADYGLIPIDDIDPVTGVLLTDVLPTAWQAVEYSEMEPGETIAVFGLGPIGRMCVRIALHRGAARVIAFDPNLPRLHAAARDGATAIIADEKEMSSAVHDLTEGRGADRVIDAVGMDGNDTRWGTLMATTKVQPDRLLALKQAMGSVRRGGTVSVVGVYLGWFLAFPLGDLFDRQVTLRWGQANVRRYSELLTEMIRSGDPLGASQFVSTVAPLSDASEWYRRFLEKDPKAFKVVLTPQ